ncbi:MAG: AAA family ATPase, partial [Actinomycetota bacterium]|nr:AAA family ATPase [Actinomycetota bacterium]
MTRAHQTAGQEIIVTSTAALAAERLTRELSDAGVTATPYSTAALHTAIDSGRVELGPGVTVVHDEAALASTREQHHLLNAIEDSGARLIEVGDPRQNQPVGAGGLWTHLETATRQAGAHVELTTSQRARTPEDRRDQARFRAGEHELAIRGYAARGHVHLADDQVRAEDAALDAAQLDRAAGRSTIVIAQTSNEHLDELNARAQAIRHQAGQLGNASWRVPGRPYALRAGDEVLIRRTIPHPEHREQQLRNGTPATVTHVQGNEQLALRLGDRDDVVLDRDTAANADLRLAYVQHPFPAQGITTDTAHLIVAEHATREGTYVALTRARERTDIHAAS